MTFDIVPFLQRLIRFDTTNPPGNERECVEFIAGELGRYGFDCTLVGRTPDRPNLITRLPGRGDAPPLLMHGHVDVVTTANQAWTRHPFSGEIVDGEIWGRGALDMKSGVAQIAAAAIRAVENGVSPAGDIILAFVADEENGCYYGSQFLVENHADLFDGVRFAVGETGGSPRYAAGRKFRPIMIGEKQQCRVTLTFRGPGGHGARPIRGGAMAKLGRALTSLDGAHLPLHIVPAVDTMLDALAAAAPESLRPHFTALRDPASFAGAADALAPLDTLFRNVVRHTVSPTGLEASAKLNVIPPVVKLHLDGRILPGFGPDDLIAELRAIVGEDADGAPEIAVTDFVAGPPAPDLGLFPTLTGILERLDPASTAIPVVASGYTDARFFAQLGIQTYGFLPLDLPESFAHGRMVHGADERVPVDALPFGVDALYQLIQEYHV